MPYLTVLADWVQQSMHLIQARPTTVSLFLLNQDENYSKPPRTADPHNLQILPHTAHVGNNQEAETRHREAGRGKGVAGASRPPRRIKSQDV